MFDDVKFLEKMLELVRARKLCLSGMSHSEDAGLTFVKTEEGDYHSMKGVGDVQVDLIFTGHSNTITKALASFNEVNNG